MSAQPESPTEIILAVDDDPMLLEMLDRILAKHPYTILHAQSGEAAIQLIQARADIDLLLLDILMPGGMNGLELCHRVRADQSRAYLPIVMLTALGHPDQIAQGLDAGADDYITKPFSPREILARVQAALRVRRIQRELVEAQDRYRVLVETSHDLIFALDTAGQLIYVSPACEALTGYSAQTILAEQPPFARLAHPDDVGRIADLFTGSVHPSDDGADLEFRIVRKDGQLRWAVLSWSAIHDRSGTTIGWQGTLRDITHRKQVEAAAWQRSQELATLNLIAARVNQSLELSTTLDEALDALMEVLGIEFGTIHVVEDDRFRLRAVHGLPGNIAQEWYQRFGGTDPSEWQACELIVGRDLIDQPSNPIGPHSRALSIQAWAIIPLRERGTLNGLLLLASRVHDKFDPAEVTLISTVAEQISAAITNSRLYEETRQRVEELALLNEIGRMLTSTLDLDKVLRVIMEATVSMLQGEAGSVLLLDEASGDLVFAAAVGPAAERVSGLHLPTGAGIAGRVLREGHSVLIADVQHDAEFYANVDRVTGLTTHMLVAAPLRTRGRIIGVMEVINKRSGQFSKADLRLLDLLSPTAAAAIDNARLYQRETQLSEQILRRNRELSALHAISAALSQSLEIQNVMDVALMMVQPLFEFDDGYISLLAEDGTIGTTVQHLSGRVPATPDRNPLAQQFTRQAVESRAVKLLPDTGRLNGHAARTWRAMGIGAFVAVPLWGHDHVQGVLDMAWREPREFIPETPPLLAAIGQQIGVAIERAQLYEVAQRRAKEIEQTYAQLVQSEKLAATGRMAMSLAHEINNPLQAIQNCLHLVLEFPLDETRRTDYLKMAREEVERLSILVQSMLDFYRPSRDGQPVADVHAILERVLALSDQKLRDNNIELALDFASGAMAVRTAPDQLGQVFLNLVVNAAEAMTAGGRLQIKAHPVGEWIETCFTDSGPGIPSDDLPHIFEPFYTTKIDGTGLGLAISYTIVERHGGSIHVESQVGMGTKFVVRLPKAQGEK